MSTSSSSESLPEKVAEQHSIVANPLPSPAGSSLSLPLSVGPGVMPQGSLPTPLAAPRQMVVAQQSRPQFYPHPQQHPHQQQHRQFAQHPYLNPNMAIAQLHRRRNLPLVSNLHWRLKHLTNGLLQSSGTLASNAGRLNEDSEDSEADVANSSAVAKQKPFMISNYPHIPFKAQNQPKTYPSTESELLVPIRIELDLENEFVLRDLFTWNIYDASVSPRKYAEILIFDLNYSASVASVNKCHSVIASIAKSIQDQIEFYTGLIAEIESKPGTLLLNSYIPIQIELHIGRRLIRDKFIWDTSMQNSVTPECYALIFCQDHGLGGENVALIATCIREQILLHFHQRILNPDFIGGGLDVSEAGICSAQRLGKTIVVDQLSNDELRQLLTKNDRQSRRLRRETARMKKSYGF